MFRAVVADSAYGDQDGFRGELAEAGLPFVMALKPRRGTWAYGPDAHTPVDAARALAWDGPTIPGDWQPVTRTFRDGHAETWWAADATLGWWGPGRHPAPGGGHRRPGHLAGQGHLVPGHQPAPPGRPARGRQPASGRPGLAEIVRIYGIRHWIEQGYKQVKDGLGWADFQVRSDVAIRRHQVLVNCAFCFCWATWFADHRPQDPAAPRPGPGGGESGAARRRPPPAPSWPRALRAVRAWLSPWITLQRWWTAWSEAPPAAAAASPDQLGRGRLRPAPLHPDLTNYR